MKNVLVFGGNGFMGAETVKMLLDLRYCSLILVNRNKSWDFGSKNDILPRIDRLIRWNRKKPLVQCSEYLDWLNSVSVVDVVIDFSGYKPLYLSESIASLRGKVSLYIYISTDSVYEICEKCHDGCTKETDDKRPTDDKMKAQLRKNDKYGYDKWKCEECLQKSEIPFVILRLADVIGEKDSTERWWQLQLWTKAACLSGVPVYIPEELKHRRLSTVYSKDVAKLVCDIVTEKLEWINLYNNAFNLAFNETPTLEELIQKIACTVSSSTCDIKYPSDDRNIPQIYPSVEKGPIDLNKSRRMLHWLPTPLEYAVHACCTFYESLGDNPSYVEKRRQIFDSVCEDLEDVYSSTDIKKLQSALKFMLSLE